MECGVIPFEIVYCCTLAPTRTLPVTEDTDGGGEPKARVFFSHLISLYQTQVVHTSILPCIKCDGHTFMPSYLLRQFSVFSGFSVLLTFPVPLGTAVCLVTAARRGFMIAEHRGCTSTPLFHMRTPVPQLGGRQLMHNPTAKS